MKKICFVCALLFSFQALAQSSLMNQLDSSVRNSGNGSMMFAQPESQMKNRCAPESNVLMKNRCAPSKRQ